MIHIIARIHILYYCL